MNVHEVSAEVRQRDESVIRRELGHHGEIAFTDEGWDSRVYIVNHGAAVFKFPRSPQTAEQYRYEIAALQVLEDLDSPVRTPRVRWEGPDLAYFGYEGVIGEPLSTRIASFDAETKSLVGDLLGRFLKALHAVKLSDARTTDVEAEISNYDEKYRLAKPALVGAFSESEVDGIERFFFGRDGGDEPGGSAIAEVDDVGLDLDGQLIHALSVVFEHAGEVFQAVHLVEEPSTETQNGGPQQRSVRCEDPESAARRVERVVRARSAVRTRHA